MSFYAASLKIKVNAQDAFRKLSHFFKNGGIQLYLFFFKHAKL